MKNLKNVIARFLVILICPIIGLFMYAKGFGAITSLIAICVLVFISYAILDFKYGKVD